MRDEDLIHSVEREDIKVKLIGFMPRRITTDYIMSSSGPRLVPLQVPQKGMSLTIIPRLRIVPMAAA